MLRICLPLFFLFALPLETAHPAIVSEQFLFETVPFPSCHAATITEASPGSFLCAWFGGSQEGAKDVAIWLSTLNDAAWSAPRKVAEVKDVPCWNPVLYTLPSKEILLFFKVGHNPQQWSGLLQRSKDGGKSWLKAEDLPAGVIGPVKNRPLLLTDGTLLCGSSIESWRRWGCWIDITPDGGKSWHKSTPINVSKEPFGIIQPALFATKEGAIKLLARSRQIGAICTSTSHDQGKTWSSAKPTALPNPNSGIDAIRLTDGSIALVYNHSKENRYPLNLALSHDEGETWTMEVTLEESPGEYSYPSLIQAEEGLIHIVYTWNRTRIKHVVLDPHLL